MYNLWLNLVSACFICVRIQGSIALVTKLTQMGVFFNDFFVNKKKHNLM